MIWRYCQWRLVKSMMVPELIRLGKIQGMNMLSFFHFDNSFED